MHDDSWQEPDFGCCGLVPAVKDLSFPMGNAVDHVLPCPPWGWGGGAGSSLASSPAQSSLCVVLQQGHCAAACQGKLALRRPPLGLPHLGPSSPRSCVVHSMPARGPQRDCCGSLHALTRASAGLVSIDGLVCSTWD